MKSIKQWWNKASTTKKIITGVIGLIIIGILFLIFGKKSSNQNLTTTVQQGNVVNNVVLSGTTQSASAVNLGFADQGRIAYVGVKEGDKVHAGQVLATLDTADLQASLKGAEAALIIANATTANNTTNVATVTAQQNTLVQNAYNILLTDHLQAVPKSLHTVSPAPIITGNYTGPEGQYIVHIYPSGANSGSSFNLSGLENGFTYEAATTTAVPLGSHGLYIQFQPNANYGNSDWLVTIPNTQSATYTVNLNAYNAAMAARTQAITAATASAASTIGQTSIAMAQIAQAQATIDGIHASIAKREVIAPFNGVIASVNVKPGQTTSSFNASGNKSDAANANISLISENDYEVVLKTPEIDVASIAVGQPVSLTLDAFGTETFPAIITSINPAETIVDGVPVYETKVSFTKLDPRIRSGMTATATINVGEKDNVLLLPVSYIHTDARGSYVYILSGKHTIQKSVTLGLRGSDSTVEIAGGIQLGDTISTDSR
jgi:HlyD family secretion protein